MTTNATRAAQAKKVLATLGPRSIHMVGDGFHVRNLFPSNALGEAISPFLLLDYAGPTQYGPRDPDREGPRGVGEHPHCGFETVTIVHQGRVAHRDSAGNSGVIGPGDVQWMTAASGVVHEEFHEPGFTRSGGVLQMVQLWVNLPARHKMSPPKYQAILADAIPRVELPGGAGHVRVIAGEHAGARGPAATFTPIDVWDVRLAAGARLAFDLPSGRVAGVVVLEGRASANGSAEVGDARMILLDRAGEHVEVRAAVETKLLVLAGEPLGEPVVQHDPFVMNTAAEIYTAIQDLQTGRMGRLVG
jgi:redox-sensitive bicupin YhaK (pirin superfamily)